MIHLQYFSIVTATRIGSMLGRWQQASDLIGAAVFLAFDAPARKLLGLILSWMAVGPQKGYE